MLSSELFLLEPGMPLPAAESPKTPSAAEFMLEEEAPPVPNFGQGNRPDLYCPEIYMREALNFSAFWQYAGTLDEAYRNEIPYWCIVWPGSRMLARYALDTDLPLKEKRVLELGCGSGLAAVAFAKRGCEVTATDHDNQALDVTAAMARRNGVELDTDGLELFEDPEFFLPRIKPDIVILGDLFYEASVADRARIWCLAAQELGAKCIVADPCRTYGPGKNSQSWGLEIISEAAVPVHAAIENVKTRHTLLLASATQG
ncbi:MAG: 50S ribosomal protein L11 methyltransferase [Leptospiraceae bacterium]